MQTEVLTLDNPDRFALAVSRAAECLRRGEIVAVPTETVYGLAANAWNTGAVAKIFQVKERPPDNPVIVHVASKQMARRCVAQWPEEAARLTERFWPGPLTVVLNKAPEIPVLVTAGGATVGVRWPRHPFMQALIERCDFPLAAPSANPSARISPTTASHVLRGLSGKIPLIIDAGPASVGIESTVIDLTGEIPIVLRPGIISREQIEAVLGRPVQLQTGKTAVLKSPGLLKKHYAPRAQLRLIHWQTEEELRRIAERSGIPPANIHLLVHERIPNVNLFGRTVIIPHDPEAYARAIYAELHRSDQAGASLILVEDLPRTSPWEAIRDRLKRASAEG